MLEQRCDLRLGDSRLQYITKINLSTGGCDLRLGDSRLQYKDKTPWLH